MLVRECDKCGTKLNDRGDENSKRKVVNINGKKLELCKMCYDGTVGWVDDVEVTPEPTEIIIKKEITYVPAPYSPIYIRPYDVGPYGPTITWNTCDGGGYHCGDGVASNLRLALGDPTNK
jgi:hypothetical protein